MLERFVSINGAKHYNLKINQEKIKLIKSKKPVIFNKSLNFENEKVTIFDPEFPIFWKIQI